MSKCKCCGEEIGINTVCPFCGTKVIVQAPKKDAPKVETDKDNSSKNILQQIEEEKIKLVERCGKSVVKVFKLSKEGYYTGTGWVIKNNLIITNAHVVNHDLDEFGDNGILVEFNDKLKIKDNKIPARVLYFSEIEDIAILEPIDGSLPSEVPALEIEDKEPKQGELVFTIGNPLHYKFTYIEGSVANPDYIRAGLKDYPILQTTIILNSGNSGGPVFNAYGKVVGMSTFSELNEDKSEIMGYGFCVKSSTILKAIKEIKRR